MSAVLAELHGGPCDGLRAPITAAPDLVTVGFCERPNCQRPHILDADVGAEPLYLLHQRRERAAVYVYVDVDAGLETLLAPEKAPAILATGRVKAAYRDLVRRELGIDRLADAVAIAFAFERDLQAVMRAARR